MINYSNNQIQIKNYSRIAMLDFIRRNRYATRSELSAVTGLTFMGIKKIIDELIELDLVREDSFEKGGIGRRPVIYTINENYGYTIGLHINIFRTKAAIMNLHGKIIESENLNMDKLPETQASFIDEITSLIKSLINKSNIDKKKILGIGIGAPGPVDSKNGIILIPPNFTLLSYLPLKQLMEQKLGLPTFVQKDANAIIMGEYWRGTETRYNNMIYIEADMGIGSGLIINGRLHQGTNLIAGEFGHVTLDIEGPQCNCGNYGCLEAIGSGIAIIKEMSRQLEDKLGHSLYNKRNRLTIDDILNIAEENDPLAISILNKAAYYMGVAISSLINVIDPQIIVLGGILAGGYKQYFDIVKDTIFNKRIQGAKDSAIIPTKLQGKAGMIGAGEIVADNFFTNIVHYVLDKNKK